MGEELIIQLRYCFAAGYTMPQFCLDKGIKRPLFVMEKAHEWFLREIYAQFAYDKRLLAQFCFIDSEQSVLLPSNGGFLSSRITVKSISDINIDDFDKIILLTKEKFDIATGKVIPFHGVLTFFITRTYVDTPVLTFLQRYPNVKFILTNFGTPNVSMEVLMKTSWKCSELEKTLKSTEKPVRCFDKFNYTNKDILEMIAPPKVITHINGTTTLADNNHPLIQIQKGRRKTAYQPAHYKNKIYFFGVCHHYGTATPYDKTIESYLQKMLNEANLPYCVENEGQTFSGRDQDRFYNLNAFEYAPGDIIFFYGFKSNFVPYCDIKDVFHSADYREIFCIDAHVNELGYKLVAERYFKFLTENNFFRDVCFNYPAPPQYITNTVYLLGSSKAA